MIPIERYLRSNHPTLFLCQVWRSLASAAHGCRPLLAITLVPAIGRARGVGSGGSDASVWASGAQDAGETAGDWRCGAPRLLRLSLSDAQGMAYFVPRSAAVVVGIDPWSLDWGVGPQSVSRLLSRPLAKGGLLLLLTLVPPNPLSSPMVATDTAASIAAVARSSGAWRELTPGAKATPGLCSDPDHDNATDRIGVVVAFVGIRAASAASPHAASDYVDSLPHDSTSGARGSAIGHRLRAFFSVNASDRGAAQLSALLEEPCETSPDGRALIAGPDAQSSDGSLARATPGSTPSSVHTFGVGVGKRPPRRQMGAAAGWRRSSAAESGVRVVAVVKAGGVWSLDPSDGVAWLEEKHATSQLVREKSLLCLSTCHLSCHLSPPDRPSQMKCVRACLSEAPCVLQCREHCAGGALYPRGRSARARRWVRDWRELACLEDAPIGHPPRPA